MKLITNIVSHGIFAFGAFNVMTIGMKLDDYSRNLGKTFVFYYMTQGVITTPAPLLHKTIALVPGCILTLHSLYETRRAYVRLGINPWKVTYDD